MTRHDEQREVADFLAQTLEDAGELDFLACVRAGGEEDGLCRCDASLGQHIVKLVDLRCGDGGSLGIVFDATGEVDAVAFDTEAFPAGDVVLFLHQDLFQHAEDWADEAAELAIATFGTRREPCVDKRDGNAEVLGGGSQIRPHFGLHEHELGRLNALQHESADARKIDGAENGDDFACMLRGKLGGERMAGGRGGAEDDAEVGMGFEQPCDEFFRNTDLSDADGMHPEAFALRQGVDGSLRGLVKTTDALREIAPAPMATAHFHDGSGQHADEAQGQHQIVESEAKGFRCHAEVCAARRCGWNRNCGRLAPPSRASFSFRG